jgi:phosphate/sulfate permease
MGAGYNVNWSGRLAQLVLLAAILGAGFLSGKAVTTGIFQWWIYPALIGLFVATFMLHHARDCASRPADKR